MLTWTASLLLACFLVGRARAQDPGQQIYFDGTTSGCLTVGNGLDTPTSGSPVYILPCTDPSTSPPSQLFTLTRSLSNQVILTSTLGTASQLCLDAGLEYEENGSEVTVYQCELEEGGDGATGDGREAVGQQNWYYTVDNHLAIYTGTQCLDVIADPTEVDVDGNTLWGLQTWACSGTDEQQIFQVDDGLGDEVDDGSDDDDLPLC